MQLNVQQCYLLTGFYTVLSLDRMLHSVISWLDVLNVLRTYENSSYQHDNQWWQLTNQKHRMLQCLIKESSQSNTSIEYLRKTLSTFVSITDFWIILPNGYSVWSPFFVFPAVMFLEYCWMWRESKLTLWIIDDDDDLNIIEVNSKDWLFVEYVDSMGNKSFLYISKPNCFWPNLQTLYQLHNKVWIWVIWLFVSQFLWLFLYVTCSDELG